MRVYFIVHGAMLRKTFGAGKYLAIKNKIRYDYSVGQQNVPCCKGENYGYCLF